jgi:polysaccharide chain length determinant protein (PEP-CTERM system associated)
MTSLVAPDTGNTPPTFGQRLQVLWRRKGTGIFVFLLVLAAASAFVMGLPSLYQASATVLVEGQVPETFVQPIVSGEIDNRLQAIKQEALSRARLTDLISRFNLYPELRADPPEVALERLQRDMNVEITSAEQANGRPSTVSFKLTYIGRDPKTAADVANTLASFYVAQNDKIRSRQVTRATDVIGRQLGETKKRLDSQEGRVQAFMTQHIGRLPQQVDANLAALERLNTQLSLNSDQQSKVMEQRQTIQKQLTELETPTAPSADTFDPAAKVARAKRELADLQARFNPTYPDVRDKQAEVARLEREAAASSGRGAPPSAVQTQKAALSGTVKELDAKLDQLSKENKALRDSMASYEGRVESAPERAPQYDALSRDYQSTRDAYDQLLKKYDDARLAESMEHQGNSEEFRILDEALPPSFAAGPNRPRLLIVAAGVALALAVIVVFLIDRADTSFHNLDELRAFTQVPVLASIPRILTPWERRRRSARAAGVVVLVASVMVLAGAGAFEAARGNDQIARVLLKVG